MNYCAGAIRRYLQSFGFELLWEAGHGEEDLQNLQAIEPFPEVCIVDINMPVMDGFTVAALRHRYPVVKVTVFSVDDDYRVIEKMLRNGIDGYLLKGGDPAELEIAIRLVFSCRKYFSEAIRPMVARYLSENRKQ